MVTYFLALDPRQVPLVVGQQLLVALLDFLLDFVLESRLSWWGVAAWAQQSLTLSETRLVQSASVCESSERACRGVE